MPGHTLFGLWLILLGGLLAPVLGHADDLELLSYSLRARFSETTLLGKEAPEAFDEYDLSANFELPWQYQSASGWRLGTRLMASAGGLHGAGETALATSLVPQIVLSSEDGRFSIDLGLGGALLSRHRFGTQDFGGPFQFALTLGIGVPLYKNLGLGYRFQHYSDAGLNGPDTIGVDLHMIEFSYWY